MNHDMIRKYKIAYAFVNYMYGTSISMPSIEYDISI